MTVDAAVAVLLAATALQTSRDAFVLLGLAAGGVTAAIYLLRRVWRAVKLLEVIAELPELLTGIDGRLGALEEADETQAEDHAEVRTMLGAMDERLTQRLDDVAGVTLANHEVGAANQERLTALARELGVEHRDQRSAA